jgi:hypothetical protein
MVSFSAGVTSLAHANSVTPVGSIWHLPYTSLRAERGNPDAVATGLPRFARNDEPRVARFVLIETEVQALATQMLNPEKQTKP